MTEKQVKGQATSQRRPVMIEYIDPETEDPVSEEEQIFSKFKDEFSEGDSYASITVFRQPTSFSGRAIQKKLVYLFECGIDEFTYAQLMSKLRDTYGNGTYRIQGRKADRTLIFNRSIDVEAAPVPPTDTAMPNPTAIMESVQRMLGEQQARTEEMLSRMNANQKQATDPMDSMVKMFGAIAAILTPLVPIFVAKTSPAAPVANDWLGELAKLGKAKDVLQDVFGGGESSGDSVESNFYDLAGKAIEHLGPMAASAIAASQAGQRRLAAPSGAAPSGAANSNGTGADRPIPELQTQSADRPGVNVKRNNPGNTRDPLKAQVDILVANAKMGTTPESMADMVLNMTPDERLEELKAFISNVHVIERMAQSNPEVRSYSQWFQALRENVLRLLSEIETDNNSTPETTGAASAEFASQAAVEPREPQD